MLDVEVCVEEKIRRLDVAVKNASRMDPRNLFGGLSEPSQPLLKRRGSIRIKDVVSYGSVQGAF